MLTVEDNDCPFPVDCVVSAWQNNGKCSVECGGTGELSQLREIEQQPENGGLGCPTELARVVPCVTKACADKPKFSVSGTVRFRNLGIGSWNSGKTAEVERVLEEAFSAHATAPQVTVTNVR